jgi:hypothetical protein
MPSFPIGRLNGVTTPAGTLLGPDSVGQLLVVAQLDNAGVTVSYATTADIQAAMAACVADGPRSVTEHTMISDMRRQASAMMARGQVAS